MVLESRDGAQMTAKPGDIVDFEGGSRGFVLWSRPPLYFLQALAGSGDITPGSTVMLREQQAEKEQSEGAEGDEGEEGSKASRPTLTISDGALKLGRAVDFLDTPLDGAAPLEAEAATADGARGVPVFNEQPDVAAIQTIGRGLSTGVTAVDALTPMGFGQSMLVAGPDTPTNTNLAVDAVHGQISSGVKCVYACLRGQDQGEAVRSELASRGALDHSVVLSAGDEKPSSATQLATAAAAIATAESFRDQGQDALVVLDDISGLADFWDLTTRTLLDTYGEDR